MKASRQKAVISSQWLALVAWALVPGRAAVVPAAADDLARLCADRTVIERVYYNHRLGQKPPFEQVSPPSLIERLVKEDLRKEAALKKVYGVEVTGAMLDAEVRRINSTTRAPDMLAEIKAALGDDPAKFAQAFAKPILVERLLRDKFENDDALHAPRRREAETLRNQLLQACVELRSAREAEAAAGKSEARSPKSEGIPKAEGRSPQSAVVVSNRLAILKASPAGQFSETTWQLGARPAETNAPGSDEMAIKQRFGPNAQVISSPQQDKDRKFYFEDLPAELQRVLRAQLRQAGDVSAVIEAPGSFLLYVAKEKTGAALTAACLTLPKRNYEQWLVEQEKGTE